MKIAYVVKRYPRFSETFIVNEILAHERAGVEVGIFSLRGSTDTHFQDRISRVRAPVTYLSSLRRAADLWTAFRLAGMRWPGFWSSLSLADGEEAQTAYQAVELAQLVTSRECTHIHAHFASESASVSRLASRFSGIPYTLTAHAKDIFHDAVDEPSLATKLRDASCCVTVSDFNQRYLEQRFGHVAPRVQRIYNGLELTEFPFASPRNRPRSIVGVGRLVEKKGFDVLIDACAALRARGTDFMCHIIGGGECEEALRRQVASLDLEAHVTLTGPRPQTHVYEAIRTAAVIAAPCVVGKDGNRDGLPTVLLEGMALGTPVISTDVTGIPEIVVHNQTGVIVDQRDAIDLADALERLLSDSELRVRLAAQARRLIEGSFDIDKNTAALRSLFSADVDPFGIHTSTADAVEVPP